MVPTSDLWIDSEVSAPIAPPEEIPPPIVTRLQILPLERLGWNEFEQLCWRLALRQGDVVDCRRYGVPGQSQKGIDIYLRHIGDTSPITWQCKCYQEFSPSDIKDAVSTYLEDSWAQTSKVFRLAVTVDLSPTKLADEIETQAKRCRERGIEFAPLDIRQLSVLLKDHPDLVDDFFGRGWVTAFCGADVSKTLSQRVLTRQERVKAREKLHQLYHINFATVDAGLPAAAGALPAGTPPLSLHKRYIFPKAEAVNFVTEAKIDPPSPRADAGSEGPASSATRHETPDGKSSGFRAVETRTKTELFDWLAVTEQAVIIADAGLGKSATLRFIALDLLSDHPRNEALARKWGSFLPIFIPFAAVVRLVGSARATGVPDLLQTWFQELSAPPETLTILERALQDERILLLIDGLDEWVDATTAGTAITKLVTFAQSRSLPVIATSRPIGHQRIIEFIPSWKRADLCPFDTAQQREFTRAWFEHYHAINLPIESATDGASGVAVRVTESFMDEIAQDAALAELAGIPLLLSALISLRLHGQVLPRNRFDALDAITKTLIHEQPQRRARSSLQVGASSRQSSTLVERGIQFLAYYMFNSPSSTAISKDDACKALGGFYREEFRKTDSEAFELASVQIDRSADEVGILIESEAGKIGFLHRGLQEFLAANHINRMPLSDIMQFILEKLTLGGWQETILAVFHLIDRKNEADDILKAIRSKSYNPLDQPGVQIFLASVAFRDLNCSVQIAEEIADETFGLIELSTWHPLREALLREVIRGLDSGTLGHRARDHVQRWFPCRVWRRSNLCGYLASASDQIGQLLYFNLFNTDSASDSKDVAAAIAKGARNWPQLEAKLSSLFTSAAEEELLAAVLHGLALGWPNHPRLPDYLQQAADSGAASLQCVALIHLARRGNRSREIKLRLSRFCNARSRVYPWEDAVLLALKDCWPRDPELREIALKSVRNRVAPTEWHDHTAIQYLISAHPQDDDVAQLIADDIAKADHVSTHFNFVVDWDDVISHFQGHPIIAPVVEKWLADQGDKYRDDFGVAHLAMLGGTQRCKELAYEFYRKGKFQVRWFIIAMLRMNGGVWTAELQQEIAPVAADPAKSATIADFLPQLRSNKAECKALLLSLLKKCEPFNTSFVFIALSSLGEMKSPDVVEAWKTRLREDANGHFWYWARYLLLKEFAHDPDVRQAAIQDINSPEPAYSALIDAYGGEPEIQSRLERLLQPLNENLRLTLVQELERFTLRNDAFAISLLSQYVTEYDPQVRVAAARTYYAAIKKTGADIEEQRKKLIQEMLVTGMDFDFRRQAAIAGLLALGQAHALLDPALVRPGASDLRFSVFAEGGANWEFIRGLVESWESVIKACGPTIWNTFGNPSELITRLVQSGQRQLAMSVPVPCLKEIRAMADKDRASFIALSALEGDQPAFKDFCLGIFRNLLWDDRPTASWSYMEMEVHLEAAHFLARRYSGDKKLAEEMVIIARQSREPMGPVIALCQGWPEEPYLKEIGSKLGGTFHDDAPQAWLASIFATPSEFAGLVESWSTKLRDDPIWRFPREIVAAARLRLAKDPTCAQKLLALLGTTENCDLIASGSRLLGATVQDRSPLQDWGRQRLELLRQANKLQPVGYDWWKGEVRAVEFSIKDACLTR